MYKGLNSELTVQGYRLRDKGVVSDFGVQVEDLG